MFRYKMFGIFAEENIDVRCNVAISIWSCIREMD